MRKGYVSVQRTECRSVHRFGGPKACQNVSISWSPVVRSCLVEQVGQNKFWNGVSNRTLKESEYIPITSRGMLSKVVLLF